MNVPLICIALVAPFAILGAAIVFIYIMAEIEKFRNERRRKKWTKRMMDDHSKNGSS